VSDAPEIVKWEKVLPLAHQARVVMVSGKLLALEKPAGIMTHPNKELDRNYSLLQASYDHERECYRWHAESPDDPGKLYLLNRIDSPTSGLVLAALDSETAATAREAFAKGEVEKIYYAIVLGVPRPHQGIWNDQLLRLPVRPGSHEHARIVVRRSGPGPSGKAATTRFEVVESHANARAMLTLVKFEPVTGRTHQLRVQSAAHGNPIVGDATYGDFPFNREFGRRTGHKRLFLHCASVRLPKLNFFAESPLPKEFYAALGKESDKGQGG
jgi:23S rRNA-/tRNA-specific pseudouridylate synthase